MARAKHGPGKEISSILATDCGSTTTKAILIEKRDGVYRLIVRGEAPTTVEKPFEDVTAGARNAIREIEELTGRKLLGDDGVLTPQKGDTGVDIFLSTSSAGGGLQMMVAGVVKTMTAESAERAALGAGAIVMDAIAVNDGRKPHQKIERIRNLRPDMILLSGGVDGGTKKHVVEIAELIAAAEPKPRLGIGFKLPIIFAGNKDAVPHIEETLGEKMDLRVVPNLRPVLEKEVLGPAREEIHNLFMEHVMAQAPGYDKLMKWTPVPIMPTPAAVGSLVEAVGKENDITVIGVDIGGATTDVFSYFKETFNRTVSANLGMSYSICNVLLEAGLDRIKRWLPFKVDDADLRNRIRNKMIRPTTIPQTLEELLIEQAISREALAMAFEHHKTLATGLKGIHRGGTMDRFVDQAHVGAESLIDMKDLGLLIGSGGVLSHAPRRIQAALMLIDGFQPEAVTPLAVDSIFMMPQLGVLATVHPQASAQVFDRDCLIRLGTVVAPLGPAPSGREGPVEVVRVKVTLPDGQTLEESAAYGEMKRIPVPEGAKVRLRVEPSRGYDVGAGPGHRVEREVDGGVCGIILDCRGRPLVLPENDAERSAKLLEWFRALDVYPEEPLAGLVES
ncbi:MAG TPA: methylaspartate mutase [Clostridiales bacterium]|nr:methylaspartate mutase [Clostridiales bacterium]